MHPSTSGRKCSSIFTALAVRVLKVGGSTSRRHTTCRGGSPFPRQDPGVLQDLTNRLIGKTGKLRVVARPSGHGRL